MDGDDSAFKIILSQELKKLAESFNPFA